VRALGFVLACLLLAAFQAVLLRWLGGGRLPLQLLVPCIAWLGLKAGNVEGVAAAAGIGYLMDLFSGVPTGLFTFLAVVLHLFSRAAGLAVDLQGRAGFAVLCGAGSLVVALGAVSLQRWFGAVDAEPGLLLLPRILAEAALAALASPLVHVGMARLDALLGREEAGLLP
jgi:rod shape-determining protein MreD